MLSDVSRMANESKDPVPACDEIGLEAFSRVSVSIDGCTGELEH
jgi:hypothetical protein